MSSTIEVKKFLSKQECETIIDFSLNYLKLEDGEIYDHKGNSILNENIRKSKVAFHEFNVNFKWLVDRITDLISNKNLIKGHDIKVHDILQFTQYQVGEHYDWHTDTDKNESASDRAYSIVIQLSDEYEGGLLEYNENGIKSFNSELGSIFIFPSHYPHRVTKISKGIRYSLVGWFSLKKDSAYQKTIF